MRILEPCLLLVFIIPNISNGKPPVPEKIRAGGARAQLTQQDRFRQVMQQMAALGPQAGAQLHRRAHLERIQMLNEILPDWTHLVPLSLLLYIDFDREDTQLQRAKKFLRLALLIRDMYQDFPLTRELRTFEAPLGDRLLDTERQELVGQAFAEAAEILQQIPPGATPEEETDYWLSLAQLEYWAHYHYAMTPSGVAEALTLATRAFENANRANQALEDAIIDNQTEWIAGIDWVRNNVRRFMANVVAPVFYLAVLHVQAQKSATSHLK